MTVEIRQARAYQRARACGTRLRLLAPTPGVRRILTLTGIHRIIPIAPPVPAACHIADHHGWDYEVWSGGDPVVLDNVRFLAASNARGGLRTQAVRTILLAVSGHPALSPQRTFDIC